MTKISDRSIEREEAEELKSKLTPDFALDFKPATAQEVAKPLVIAIETQFQFVGRQKGYCESAPKAQILLLTFGAK